MTDLADDLRNKISSNCEGGLGAETQNSATVLKSVAQLVKLSRTKQVHQYVTNYFDGPELFYIKSMCTINLDKFLTINSYLDLLEMLHL